ncbi:MAG: FAD-binding oxidoreductase, partial [Maritimibacter sp.]
PSGTVHAKRLLIATNGYSSEDVPHWLAGRTMPKQSSVIVTRPLTAEERAAQGWTSDLMAYDSRSLLHYFRLMPDGRFLFGMRGGLNARPGTEARIRAKIRADFNARSFTPYTGPVPGMKNTWTSMAYHGNGVAMASYGGALVADLMRGRAPTHPYPATMQTLPGRFPLGRRRRVLLAAGLPLKALSDML